MQLQPDQVAALKRTARERAQPEQEPTVEAAVQEPAKLIEIVEAPTPTAPIQAQTVAHSDPNSLDPRVLQEVLANRPTHPNENPKNKHALREEAVTREEKERFYQLLQDARKPPPEPPPPQPVCPAVRSQTEAEMAAGRAQVQKNAEARALNPPPPPDPSNGMMTAVFRPEEYVPNMNQGRRPTDTARGL